MRFTLGRSLRCIPALLLTSLTFLSPATPSLAKAAGLPLSQTFKGRAQFDKLLESAAAWRQLPIGERTAAVGRALCGTPYKSFTLEIDDHVEAPSVNFEGLDCWTFFETALGFARMLDEPIEKWTPENLLAQIERDRYRGGVCTGGYLSRLHYLEEWLADNHGRGLVQDLTRTLGGVRAPHPANEMTINWKTYRYIRANPSLRAGIRDMEQHVTNMPFSHIPKALVASIESKLRSGDIIGITTHDPGGIGTSHVGLAYRGKDGVLRFMHASAPRNYGKVVLDSRLSDYLNRYRSDAGILVARPLR
jgi:hypothetical protein